MTLAEARALCPALSHADHQPEHDLKSLEAFARWMMRFSPVVAIESSDALLLDVTGTERLFGGFDRLLGLVSDAILKFGFHYGIAIASTPGSAWALASFSQGHPAIITPEQLPDALSSLPIAALRLDIELIQAFHGLGIDKIGQLMQLPRAALPARFGTTVLTRLDQALGHLSEPLQAVERREPIQTQLKFEGVVDSLEVIWEVLKRLLEKVIRELKRRDCGARKLLVEFLLPRAPALQKTISLSRPSSDSAGLFNLMRCATETVKSHDGFAGVRLSVPVFERLPHEQFGLLDSAEQAGDLDFDHLIERLKARMGDGTVLCARLVESHRPEKTYLYTETDADNAQPAAQMKDQCPKARPLHLLPEPVEVFCMASASPEAAPVSFTHMGDQFQVVHASGPERIAGTWWEGRSKTRDYFDAEDSMGRRFWVFRVLETRKWYLHGIFDC